MNENLFDAMRKRPEDFKVLERVPFTTETQFPIELDCAAGDEISLVIADVETTGFDPETCGVTQLGLTKVAYSPSLGRLTSIQNSGSWLNYPGHPIPKLITDLTGLSDADVANKQVTAADIAEYLEGDAIFIAHNAGFDRRFCEMHLPFPQDLRWGCSAGEIAWKNAGFESFKLEYLVYKVGAFYSGHRADIDTLAVAWLFFKMPDVIGELLKKVAERTVIIRAINTPFDRKDELKSFGFKWDDGSGSHQKHWHFTAPESELAKVMEFLNGVYPNGKNQALVELVTARDRFKK